MTSEQVSVRILGPLYIEGNGYVLGPRSLGGVKPKQVLEILLLKRGRLVSKDMLAEAIWGDQQPRNADATLSTYVSILRTKLAPVVNGKRSLIVTAPGAYAVDMSALNLDVDRFDALVGEVSITHPTRARAVMNSALSLVGGRLLEDEPYAEWSSTERDHYSSAHTNLLVEAARSSIAADDFAAAFNYASQAVVLDRLHEAALQLCMISAYGCGHRDTALRNCRTFEVSLHEELGLTPTPATLALRQSIERQDEVSTLLECAVDVPLRSETYSADMLPFLGRAEAMAAIQISARVAKSGSRQTLEVHGEHGIGRSRLLTEAMNSLGGFASCWVACNELERGIPGSMLVTLFGAIKTHGVCSTLSIPAAINSAGEGELIESLAEAVQTVGPVAVFIDDLQWADTESLDVLAQLSGRCSSMPLLIVIAWRSDTMADETVLRWLRPDTTVSLQPLTLSEVEALNEPGLFERSGGLPLFVASCSQPLQTHSTAAASSRRASDVPQTLAQAVVSRWRAEGAAVYSLLVTASALGETFTTETVARVCNLSFEVATDRLNVLCQLGALAECGSGFTFRYGLVRNVLGRTLSSSGWQLVQAKARQSASMPEMVPTS